MRTMSKEFVDYLKQSYPKGTRIQLDHMGDDDPNPVPAGEKGTVAFVDDIGTVFVDFDCGRSMGICPEVDSFHKISEQTESQEPQMSM